jgi:alpha-tubulin suppressor-like RCC1 family protein
MNRIWFASIVCKRALSRRSFQRARLALVLAIAAIAGGTPAYAAITAISAGNSNTCVVKDGGVQCWGDNFYGQLGNGTRTPSATPVQTVAAGSGATTVSVGALHACAVVAGGAKCWGYYDGGGSLGDALALGRGAASSTDPSNTAPTDVQGLAAGSGVTAISVGANHTCAIISGAAKCWGNNIFGRLGTGNSISAGTPQSVANADDLASFASGVESIAAGVDHTCAIKSGGALYCWGRNAASGSVAGGRLFVDSTTLPSIAAPKYVSINNATAIALNAGAFHSCAVRSGTTINCVGDNLYGQQGPGYVGNPSAAANNAGSAAALGTEHTCALVDGGARCWGRNDSGQLGNGNTAHTGSSSDVLAFRPSTNAGVTHLAAGSAHTCAVVNQQVRCWGDNSASALGVFYDNLLAVSIFGNGVVTSSVGNINCGASCSASLWRGEAVTLTAAPAMNSFFSHWTGVTCNEGNTSATCTFVMEGAYQSTLSPVANFAAPQAQTINFPAISAFSWYQGSATLNATASSGLAVSYSVLLGACALSANIVTASAPTSCTIAANQAGNASFTPAPQVTRVVTVNNGPALLDIDASGVATMPATKYDAATDGVMVLRYLFGYTNSATTANAMGASATRDAAQINAHLQTIQPLLDINGDGDVKASIDGLIIVRYMIGLRSTALVANLPIGTFTVSEIETRISRLMP